MLAPEAFAKAAGGPAAGYPLMALVFGGLCCVLILVAFARVRERPEAAQSGHFPFFEGLRVTFRNRAFVVLMFTYLIALIGGSFIAPLTLYVAKYVIKAREVVPFVMLAYLAGSVVVDSDLGRACRARIGKNRTWSIGDAARDRRVRDVLLLPRGHLAALDRARGHRRRGERLHDDARPLDLGRRDRLGRARDRPPPRGRLHGDLVLHGQGRHRHRDLHRDAGARGGRLRAELRIRTRRWCSGSSSSTASCRRSATSRP